MGHAEIQKHIRDIFTKYLNRRGHRKTPERFLIMETIYRHDGHWDVDGLYSLIKKQGTHISRATVYNTLELLLDAGLVRKHYFSPKAAYYEKSYYKQQHDHIIVLNENGEPERIIEFCEPRIENIKKDLENYLGISIRDHDLYFYAKPQKHGSTEEKSQ